MSSHALSTSTDWPEAALPKRWIESLFSRMAYTYGNRFADQWANIDPEGMKKHWAASLACLTDEELLRGVRALASRDWPPTLPEFMKLCRPVLDPAVAYQEAVVQGSLRDRGEPDSWSCPAVFWAWKRIGAHDFTHLSYAILRPRWEAALTAELAVENPAPIPAQAHALPAPGKGTTDLSKARSMLVEARAVAVAGEYSAAGDKKRWAREVIERHERGEDVTYEQLKTAKAALGVA